MAISRHVGAYIKRIEDPKLITGQGTYVDNLRLPSAVYAAILRSPHSRAKIRQLDLSRARAHPRVVAVYSAQDFGDTLPLVPGPEGVDFPVPDQFILAGDEVRYVGEPVAVILAEDRYAAWDGLDLVEVGYDQLSPVVDPFHALDRSAPLVHQELGTNVAYTETMSKGSVEEAFAEAEVRIRQQMRNQRLSAVSLEGRAVAVQWQQTDSFTMWNSTQVPHELRDLVAKSLGMRQSAIRIIAPDVGGGFGPKLHIYPEDLLLPLVAKRVGRPVLWTESRREYFSATSHGRGQVADVEVAARKDGMVLGLRVKIIADLGAYLMRYTAAVPTFTRLMIQGPYAIKNIHVDLIGVYTNKVPVGPYRGAGRPEATYYIERAMDLVAAEIGLDPAMVRERNFIAADQFPYETPSGVTYDSGNYTKALERALELADYPGMRRKQQACRAGTGQLLGIGLSSYVEICSFGPMEYGAVRINEDTTVTVQTGTSPHGQGGATALAQIVADVLDVTIDQINVVHGDTSIVPKGHGTSGSRTITEGGTAVLQAAQTVREQVFRVAGHLLEASHKDLVIERGQISVVGTPERTLSLQQITDAVYREHNVPEGVRPELAASREFALKGSVFPFGTHVSVVEVDSETGQVHVLLHVAVDDCGTIINPVLVAGQIHGGIAQGVGQALYEEIVYDDQGQLLTASLMDYAVPKTTMMPALRLDHTVTPSPKNPLGVKGVGEAGTIGSTAAVVNAVVDALSHYGVRHLDTPLTPAKVWAAIQLATITRA